MRRLGIVAAVLLIALFTAAGHGAWGNPAQTPPVKGTRSEILEIEKVIRALDEAIKARLGRLDELEREMRQTEKDIIRIGDELKKTEARLGEMNVLFAGRVRGAYRKGSFSYLDVLLNAETISDFIIQSRYLSEIIRHDAELIAGIRGDQALIQERKTALETKRSSLEDLLYQKDAERRNLEEQKKEQARLLAASKEKLVKDLPPMAKNKPVYGVVLDNQVQARPQTGLSQASVVYEYEVEGSITRYLALFSEFPKKVGPIRSTRSHSAMLALENDVRFIHAGGGYDVIALVREWNMRRTDALTSGSASFFRDSSRKAPHNLYVNLAALNHEEPSEILQVRPIHLIRKGAPGTTLSIKYSTIYNVRYDYIQSKGAYRRYINDQQHKDATGKEILARNIILQYAPHKTDLRGRPTPDLLGEGPIDFYCEGRYFRGTWRKSAMDAPTQFYYQDGQLIEFIYGQTWIQIVRGES